MDPLRDARLFRALRSLLFIPALEKFLSKVERLKADAFIVDLEDSITPADKPAALERATAFFRTYNGSAPCFARLNRSRLEEELAALRSFSSVAGFMIPKTEGAKDLEPYRQVLAGKLVIALVETPLGMARLEETASADLVDILALGGEDLTCALNAESSFNTFYYYRSRIVMYAKAFGKLVYDTPSLNYRDVDVLTRELVEVAALGFDGKLAIHPSQTGPIEQAFTRCDPEEAAKIVQAFEGSGQGVLVYNGKVYEKPHIDRLRKLLNAVK